MTGAAQLRVSLLGHFQVTLGERAIPASAWRLRTAAGLVKLLALAPAYRLHREQLMDTLWPDAEPEAAANNLRYSLHAARRSLAWSDGTSPYLQRVGELLALGPPEMIWTDVTAFEAAVSAAWQGADPLLYQRAVALYAGDLLPEDPYEDWVVSPRTALRASYLTLLSRLAEVHEQREELGQAIDVLQHLLTAEPTQEAAHAGLMRLYALTGQRRQALDQFDRLTEVLARELDAEPEPAARQLYEAIRTGRLAAVQPLQPVSQATVANAEDERRPWTPSKLPVPVGELIGRERELAELAQLLRTSRLVTLTGPGGIGKTRLALALGQTAQDSRPDGAVFVDLAPLRDPSLVLETIARTLGVQETGDVPLFERLTTQLAERKLLMVLDNFEQVAAAAPTVADLMAACPRLQMLVTSRVRLRLRGEQEYPVGPLALPDLRHLPPPDELVSYPAVALFLTRTREVKPTFQLTDATADAVAVICHRLDGIPLAIELAATRIKVLTPQALLGRLAHRLDLLTAGARDAPARQQTLRDTIVWSYELLSLDVQRLFHRLAVFAGGCTLESLVAVCGDDSLDEIQALDLVAELVDQSLVVAEERGDEARYRMPETIREYAGEQLETSGESEIMHRRHGRWFLAFARERDAELRGAAQLEALDRLEGEHDNLRAALQWALQDELETAANLASAMSWFWHVRGYIEEGRHWLQQVLATEGALSRTARARALDGLGVLATDQGDFVSAERLLGESLALLDESDSAERAAVHLHLGTVSREQGQYQAAKDHWQESMRLYRERSDHWGSALALNSLAVLEASEGRLDRARILFEESLSLRRQIGDGYGLTESLSNLGLALRYLGDYDRSEVLLKECVALGRKLRLTVGVAIALSNLGWVSLDRGDHKRAASRFRESLALAKEIEQLRVVGECFEGLASVAVGQQHHERAVCLFSAAEAVYASIGFVRTPDERVQFAQSLGPARDQLDAATFADVWSSCQILSIDQAVTYALADTQALAAQAV